MEDPPTYTNVIEFINFGSTGNSQDFGDSSTQVAIEAKGSSSTRALLIGGVDYSISIILLIFSQCHL